MRLIGRRRPGLSGSHVLANYGDTVRIAGTGRTGAICHAAVPAWLGGRRRPMSEDAIQRSKELFTSGCDCAGSVLMAIAESHEVSSEVIPGYSFCQR